jgi:hypothetical protein
MSIKIVLLTAHILASLSIGFAQSHTTPKTTRTASGIREVDFLDYSYRPSVCPGIPKTVKVRQGKFKRGDYFYNIAADEIGYGDVNGDGSEDAVIQIRCGSSAGTLRAFELQVYIFQNGRAKLWARLDSERMESDYKKNYPHGIVFYPGEKAPKIEHGHLIVEALTDGSFAGPENIATFDYKSSAGKFILSGKPTRIKRTQ